MIRPPPRSPLFPYPPLSRSHSVHKTTFCRNHKPAETVRLKLVPAVVPLEKRRLELKPLRRSLEACDLVELLVQHQMPHLVCERKSVARGDGIRDAFIHVDRISVSRKEPIHSHLVAQARNRNYVDPQTRVHDPLDVDWDRCFRPKLL